MSPTTLRLTMRCPCGGRETIFTSRTLPIGWSRDYVCGRCAPTLEPAKAEPVEKLVA